MKSPQTTCGPIPGGALHCLSMASGAVVLSLELLCSRMLGPVFGNSLVLWTGVIVVTLGALSVGYAVGGLLAESARLRQSTVFLVQLAAGAWTATIPYLRQISELCDGLGLGTGVILAASCLVGFPLIASAMMAPCLVRLMAYSKSIPLIGYSAGALSASGALGSIMGALVTCHVLIPYVGISRSLAICGLAYIGTGVLGLYWIANGRARKQNIAWVGLFFGAMAIAWRTNDKVAQGGSGLVCQLESQYADIAVLDHKGTRRLYLDRLLQNSIDKATKESRLPYTNLIGHTIDRLLPSSGKALILGLGGGTIANALSARGWTVDAVELDPAVALVAQEYFGVCSKVVIHVEDARRFLSSTMERYDAIVVDVLGHGFLPAHLTTCEFWGIVRSRTNSRGIAIANVVTDGAEGVLAHAIGASLLTSFRDVVGLPMPKEYGLQNVIFVAREGAIALDVDRKDSSDLQYAMQNQYRAQGDCIGLTDDLNPSEVMMRQVHEALYGILRTWD